MIFKAKNHFNLSDWLSESAPALLPALKDLESSGNLQDLYLAHNEKEGIGAQNYAMLLNCCLTSYEATVSAGDTIMQRFVSESCKSSSASDHSAEDDHGTDVGGEWDEVEFVIRSGIVLSLGALEEFERGTLRILCSWDDKAKNGHLQCKPFYPRLADYGSRSLSWERAERKRVTYSVGGRHNMMRKFEIDPDAQSKWNTRIRRMRTDRNTIAHGERALSHPFQSFLQLHYDIFSAVCDVSRQVEERWGIIL